MAATWQSVAVGKGSSTSPSASIASNNDDLLVAFIQYQAASGSPTINTPSGWELIGELNIGQTYRRTAVFARHSTSGGATVAATWTLSATCDWQVELIRINDGGGSTRHWPRLVSSQLNTNTVNATAPSLTTTWTDALLLWMAADPNGRTYTPPSGMTERWDERRTGTHDISQSGATVSQAGAGATGAKTGTVSSATDNVAWLLAIGPDTTRWWNATTETWETTEVFNRSYQPQVASKTENQQTGTSTAIVIDKPAGTVEGSLLFASIAPCRDSVTFTPPAGWTLIEETTGSTGDGAPAIATYYKYATSSEPANYSFGYTQTTAGCVGVIYRITGAAASNPVGTVEAEFSDNATGTTIPIPQVTPLLENSLLLAIGAFRDTAGTITVTPPTGMTEETEHRATFVTQEIARVVVSAGATGTKTITLSATATFRKGQLLAIAPAIPATIDQYTFPSDTWDEGDYEWTVATKDTGGQAGPYAAVRSLTVDINDPPTAPTLVSPADAATIQQGDANAFDWTHNDPESDAQSSWSLRRST